MRGRRHLLIVMPEPAPTPPQNEQPTTDVADEPTPRRTIVVGAPPRDEDEGAPLVSTRDLGSASRSCLAIIVVLLFIALLVCIFLAVQPFR